MAVGVGRKITVLKYILDLDLFLTTRTIAIAVH